MFVCLSVCLSVPYAFGGHWTDLDETWWGDTL